jgi:outer membrane protein assembly factor BamB
MGATKAPRTSIEAILAILLAAGSLRAGDWPQWRGPFFNGSADETHLPASFSRTENLAWTAAMPGASGATPIVLGQRIFVSSTVRNSADLMGLCLRLADGQVIWRVKLARAGPTLPRGDYACPSPVTDGRRVVFTYGTGEIVAVDLDGKELWRRDLTKEYGCLAIMFGFSSSPLLYEGRLFVAVLRRHRPYSYNHGAKLPRDGPLESYLLAIDPQTGKTLFRHIRQTDAVDESREAYTTPVPCEAAGRKAVVLNGGTYVTAHDPATGGELWRWRYDIPRRPTQQRVIPSVVVGEGLIFAPQARGEATIALKPGGSGLIPQNQYVWRFGDLTCDASTQLLYRGRLYALDGDEKVLSCLEPQTGKVTWRQRIGGEGPYRASPTGADGRVYCLSEGGDVVVLAAGDRFGELSRFSLDSRPCRSSIVAAGGSLLIRTAEQLLCLRRRPAGS